MCIKLEIASINRYITNFQPISINVSVFCYSKIEALVVVVVVELIPRLT